MAGVYAQRPKEAGYFLLRVKIPGGRLTTSQAEVIAKISRQYARSTIDITTRQSVEFHWLTIESLPDVLKQLDEIGLTTIEAAGDCPRNIIINPLAGIDPDEIVDISLIAERLNAFFHNNRDFSNLPRKFKIGITGSTHNSIKAEINDLAFVPAVRAINGQKITGFMVLIGGGLSHQPRLARRPSLFVLPHEVVKVAAAVATIFRNFGYREKRNHARLKFLLDDWGEDKFMAELLKITGPLHDGGDALSLRWDPGRNYGIHSQKQKGLFYWGVGVTGGKLSPEELLDIAKLADRYGNGAIITTNTQNLIVPNISQQNIAGLKSETFYINKFRQERSLITRIVSCPGKEFCPFALTETKGRIASIASAVEEAVGQDIPIQIHLSGCGNTCGQSQIADIGLQGAAIQVDGQVGEAFEFWLGGGLGENARLAVKIPEKIAAKNIEKVVAGIIKEYIAKRQAGESFAQYIDRSGSPNLAAFV